jgi:nitrogen-specific signal transduction histidine kinase
LSDERVNVGPLLAQQLGAGIVLLDGALACSYADDRACELLGAPNAAALRADWHRLRDLLHLHDLAGVRDDPLMQRAVDLVTAQGRRRLRIEVHPLPPADCVVLIRDVHDLDAADRLLILASEACASRPALAGLVHRAKGPLNNFQLTLALLAGSLARSSAASTDASFPKWQRYLDVLQAEYGGLTECIQEIALHAHAGDPERFELDVNQIASDVARLLRHEATLRDATIEAEVPQTPSLVLGDPRGLHLALVGFALCVLDRTQSKGSVKLNVVCDDSRVRIRVAGTPALPVEDLVRTLFALSAVCTAPHAHAVAGRLIVELHDGEVSMADGTPNAWGFVISFPLAQRSSSTR